MLYTLEHILNMFVDVFGFCFEYQNKAGTELKKIMWFQISIKSVIWLPICQSLKMDTIRICPRFLDQTEAKI